MHDVPKVISVSPRPVENTLEISQCDISQLFSTRGEIRRGRVSQVVENLGIPVTDTSFTADCRVGRGGEFGVCVVAVPGFLLHSPFGV